MRDRAGIFLGFAILLAILVVAWRSDSLVAGYAYKSNMAEAAAATFTALIGVALVVERAMALANAILFGEAQRAAEQSLMTAQANGVAAMADVLGRKERLRLFGAFVAGLFVSAAGVRTLEGLLVTDGANGPANSLLFPVDVVLTAALIAGGSNGLAFLLQLAKDRLAQGNAPAVAAAASASPGALTTADIAALRARLMTTG